MPSFSRRGSIAVWWLSLVNRAGLSVVIRIGVLVIFRARQDKVRGSMRWLAVSLVMVGTSWGQAAPGGQPSPAVQSPPAPAVSSPEASGGTITGTVKAGAVPLPGVGVTATNTLTGKKYATTTDVNGSFAMAIPRNGRYVVRTELAAFAPETKEVLINAAGENGGKTGQGGDFGMEMGSRAQQGGEEKTAGGGRGGAGMQALSVTGDGAEATDASAGGSSTAGAQLPSLGGLGGEATASDSVTVNGAVGQTNGLAGYSEDDIRQRIQDAVAQAQRQGGAAGDMANVVVGMLGAMMGGAGFGGPGGGPGGGGGGGGRGGRGGGGGGGGWGGFWRLNSMQQ